MDRKQKYGIRDGFDLKYEDRLVAFLDLLGFKNLIAGRNDGDVDFVVNLIPDMLKTHSGNSGRADLEVTYVSDSIVISLKTTPTQDALRDLQHLAIYVGRLQHELALNGFYMRGGVSVGPFFHNSAKNILVGPAFLDAYKLETCMSVMPRVIIDNKVKEYYGLDSEAIVKNSNSEFVDYIYAGALIKRIDATSSLHLNKFDLMIDYVSPIFGRAKRGFAGDPQNFFNHLSDALSKGVKVEKYVWLAKWGIEAFEGQDDDLKGKYEAEAKKVRDLLKNHSKACRISDLNFALGISSLVCAFAALTFLWQAHVVDLEDSQGRWLPLVVLAVVAVSLFSLHVVHRVRVLSRLWSAMLGGICGFLAPILFCAEVFVCKAINFQMHSVAGLSALVISSGVFSALAVWTLYICVRFISENRRGGSVS